MRGYSENEAGDVVLTMSRKDYERLLMMVGMGTGAAIQSSWSLDTCLAFVNRLNAGNPNYRPYSIDEAQADV